MAVHWWRTDKLVNELRLDHVTEDQSLRYAMIDAVLLSVTLYYAYWLGAPRNWLLFLELIAVCVISIVGLNECFKANGGSASAHFLKRFLCLGVPVGLKFFLFSVAAGHLFYLVVPRIVTTENFRNPPFVYDLGSFVFVGAFTTFYYWRIAYHMERIASVERSNPSIQADAR